MTNTKKILLIVAVLITTTTIISAQTTAQNDLKDILKFEQENFKKMTPMQNQWADGWYNIDAQLSLSEQKPYEGRFSMKMKVLKEEKNATAYFYLGASTIEKGSITLTGKYRYEKANLSTFEFKIEQLDRYMSPVADTKSREYVSNLENSEWSDFSVESTMLDNIHGLVFSISYNSRATLYVDDIEIRIDGKPIFEVVKLDFPAKNDTEFDNGSQIIISELTPQIKENLDVLARVWGFVMHYHPEITMGNVNIDYELFRILPLIVNAKQKEERSTIIEEWIDKLGKITEYTEYKIEDKNQYSRIVDLSWINNKEYFSESLSAKLNEVKNAKRSSKFNYYAITYSGSKRDKYIGIKERYSNIGWEDQGYRLLSLFRFWNLAEYGFPYIELTDIPWSKVLTTNIESIINVSTEREYAIKMRELIANLNDSHGSISSKKINNHSLKNPDENFIPIRLEKTLKDEFVVLNSQVEQISIGDIILKVNNKNVMELFADKKKQIIASNDAAVLRNLKGQFLFSNTVNKKTKVTLIRDGKRETVEFENTNSNINVGLPPVKPVTDYNLKTHNIAYLNLGQSSVKQAVEITKNSMNSKGLIIDLRIYPKGYTHKFISEYLMPQMHEFMWFTSCELDFPGNFKLYNKGTVGKDNVEEYYKGKIVLLVNEGTQSLGEMATMALRCAPNSVVLGSTTAGADGNVGRFLLPLSSVVSLTTIGAYYPNWEVCQRAGVKVDIEVRPTVESIKEKRDIVLEKAIEYIESPINLRKQTID